MIDTLYSASGRNRDTERGTSGSYKSGIWTTGSVGIAGRALALLCGSAMVK